MKMTSSVINLCTFVLLPPNEIVETVLSNPLALYYFICFRYRRTLAFTCRDSNVFANTLKL